MSLWRVFNKTTGFLDSGSGFQKQQKQTKNTLFLSAKLRTPFRQQGAPISGEKLFTFKIAVWGGSYARQMMILFLNTVPTPVIDQKKESPSDGQKRQKAAAAASRIAHSGVLTL